MDRRDFLRASTIGVSGATFGSQLLFGNSSIIGVNDKIVLALIGCGDRGLGCIINCCKNNENVVIKTVCDVNKTKLANAADRVEKTFGYRPGTTDEMRNIFDDKDVDAVWIATPEHWHMLAAIRACQAGKDVYVEKNLSVNIFESRKLVEAAAKYNRIVQAGLQNRSASQGFSAREYIQSGKLGKIVTVKTYFMLGGQKFTEAPATPVPAWLDWDKWLGSAPMRSYSPSIVSEYGRGDWQNYWDYSGGLLDDEASHTLDFTRMVIGDPPHPKAVYGWGGNYAYGGKGEVPEVQSVTFDLGEYVHTADGGPSYKYMQKASGEIRNDPKRFPNWRTYSARVEIYGTEGLMYLGRHGGGWQVLGSNDQIVAQDGAIFPDNAHQKDFIECLRSRKQPNGNIEECHRSATLVNIGNIACRVRNKQLLFDGKTEKFIGNKQANILARGKYRKRYEVPENV
ncbi:MAG: putative oxidoreductase YhhX [Candidatus Ordinivivax streblomastigis]|uniref:Putative oxidoreductase YhhX n=1 Tax=Candidatus Ordinivivax streblomastigis TaxID=2540710 RepID=A0A5M8NSB5_9BACT|nr:MAG: putative oxidoreductase YhhX [Candidatus Ordinivivax streblomastigis]